MLLPYSNFSKLENDQAMANKPKPSTKLIYLKLI